MHAPHDLRRAAVAGLAALALGVLAAGPSAALSPAAPVSSGGPAAVTTAGAGGPATTSDTGTAADAAADQVLTWTADGDVDSYETAPETAVAGPATIVFENSTATGNTIGMSHTLTFDRSTPGYNHDVTLDILANPLDANGGRYEADVVLTPGTYRYFCSIPGHGTMSGEFVVTEGDGGGGDDTTPPTVTPQVTGDQNADGAYVGAATVALDATDAGSGVESVEYRLDDGEWQPYGEPFDVTAPGTHTVTHRATDAAGNTSEPGEVSFTVIESDGQDVTPPEVTAEVDGEQDADGAYVGSATVSLAATDTGSGVAGVEYRLTGGEWTEYTEPVVLDTPRMHMVSYRATDTAGNTSEPATVHVTVVADDGGDPGDITPPEPTAVLDGEQNADGSYHGQVRFTVDATDDDSGVASVSYRLGDGAWNSFVPPAGYTVSAPGTYRLAYRATDRAGNTSGEQDVSFVVGPEGDWCPFGDDRPAVAFGGIGTGVANVDTGDGCTVSDLIDPGGEYADHDAFVAHVEEVTDTLVADGVLTRADARAILRAARKADIP